MTSCHPSLLLPSIQAGFGIGFKQSDRDDVRRLLIANTNVTLLAITLSVSMLYFLFELLMFQNWRMKWSFGMVTRIWYVWMAMSHTQEITTTQEKNEPRWQQNNNKNDESHQSCSPQQRNGPSHNPHHRPLPPPPSPILRCLHPPPRTSLRLVFLVHNLRILCSLHPRICHDDSPALFLNYRPK